MGADWQTIGREILTAARNELYLNLPFLDAALCALPFAEGFDTPTLATDTKVLYYNGAWLASRYERARSLTCLLYTSSCTACPASWHNSMNHRKETFKCCTYSAI